MRALVVLSVVLIGCATPRVVSAPAPVVPVAPRPPPPPRPPPHAEYGQLRPFHNYYRVVKVGPYRHHFIAFFHHLELVTAVYEVPVEPGAAVEFRGDSFGLITTEPKTKAVPAEVASLAAAVKRDLVEHHEARAGGVSIEYLGAYRSVVIEEISIRPQEGYGHHYTLLTTLACDEALTTMKRAPFAFDHGGSSIYFGEAEPPQWIDASPGRQGKAQLWKFFTEPTLFDAASRAQFEEGVLVAARRTLKNETGPRLQELKVEREATALPEDRETKMPVIFYVDAVEGGRRQVTARAWIDPMRAFGGSERVQFELTLPCNDGLECRFSALLVLRGQTLPRDVSGEVEVPLKLDWSIRGPRGNPLRSGTVDATARVFVDGQRAAWIDAKGGVEQQNFPGLAQFSAFEAHLGFMHED
ncbi:MAG: hypothetical protein QM817_11490 [Archangium sp.]